MARLIRLLTLIVLLSGWVQAQVLTPVANARLDSICLLNVDSNKVCLDGFRDKKALVLVFTGNHCVYSKKYEDRLIQLARTCSAKGAAFVLVNSNSPTLSQDDRFALMQARAREQQYPCPYLHDPQGRLAKAVGATKNPEAFIYQASGTSWKLAYSGKIDDNPLMDTRVEQQFLRDALDALLAGQTPPPSQAALGCNIKQ
jgi:hypothetical protein